MEEKRFHAGTLFREAVENAAKLAGGWVVICSFTDEEDAGLPTGVRHQHRVHYHPWCRICHKVQEKGVCVREHSRWKGAEDREGSCLRTCWAGVTEAAVPVGDEDEPKAAILLGGCRKGSFAELPQGEALLQRLEKYGVSRKEAIEVYETLPLLQEETLESTSRLLSAFLRAMQTVTELTAGEKRGGENSCVAAARDCILTGLFHPGLSVSSVAEQLGISREHLSRVYRKETGETIGEYIRRARWTRTQLLLENTDMSVAGIAEAVGFQDPAYFSRAFRKLFGMTPGEYRESHKHPPEEI